jgi:hypothetical protein
MDGIHRLRADWSGANSHDPFANPRRRGDALGPADSCARRSFLERRPVPAISPDIGRRDSQRFAPRPPLPTAALRWVFTRTRSTRTSWWHRIEVMEAMMKPGLVNGGRGIPVAHCGGFERYRCLQHLK